MLVRVFGPGAVPLVALLTILLLLVVWPPGFTLAEEEEIAVYSIDTDGVPARSFLLTLSGQFTEASVGVHNLPAGFIFDYHVPAEGELRIIGVSMDADSSPLQGPLLNIVTNGETDDLAVAYLEVYDDSGELVEASISEGVGECG